MTTPYIKITNALKKQKNWQIYTPIPLMSTSPARHNKLDLYWQAKLSESWFKRSILTPWYSLRYWLSDAEIHGYFDRSLHLLYHGFDEGETLRPGREAIYEVIQSGRLEPLNGFFSNNLRLVYSTFSQTMSMPQSWYYRLASSLEHLKDLASAKIKNFFLDDSNNQAKIKRYEALVEASPDEIFSTGLYQNEKDDIAQEIYIDSLKQSYENMQVFLHSSPYDDEAKLYRDCRADAYELLAQLIDLVEPQIIDEQKRNDMNQEYSRIITLLDSKPDDFFFAKLKDDFMITASKFSKLAKIKNPGSQQVAMPQEPEKKPASPVTYLRGAHRAVNPATTEQSRHKAKL